MTALCHYTCSDPFCAIYISVCNSATNKLIICQRYLDKMSDLRRLIVIDTSTLHKATSRWQQSTFAQRDTMKTKELFHLDIFIPVLDTFATFSKSTYILKS